jgi:ATP-dependent protease ClpP protease subunit
LSADDTNPELIRAKVTLALAEAKKFEAETKVFEQDQLIKEAEARQKMAHAVSAEYGAESMRIQTEATLRQEKLALASNHYYHEYEFSASVYDDAVSNCLTQLALWHRLEPGERDVEGNLVQPGCDMNIVMDSPGGSVIDGMHLFDQILTYSLRPWDDSKRPRGTHSTRMTVRGYAASMAGILLQSADERVIGPESYLMIHEVASFAAGKIGEIKDEVKFLDKVSNRVANIFVSRSGGKITHDEFNKNWNRTDWWLTSEEALELGFVDRIG